MSRLSQPAQHFTNNFPFSPSARLQDGLWSSCAGQRTSQPRPDRRAPPKAAAIAAALMLFRLYRWYSFSTAIIWMPPIYPILLSDRAGYAHRVGIADFRR